MYCESFLYCIDSHSDFPPTLCAYEPINNRPKTTYGAESLHKRCKFKLYTARTSSNQRYNY